MNKTSVLFVCLGNICRSPAAEVIFRDLVSSRGLKDRFFIDSAGTSGFHDGEKADTRMISALKKRDYSQTSISRKFIKNDFNKFDYIIVMDESNYQNVLKLSSDPDRSKVLKMTDFKSPKNDRYDHVPDPYFGGDDGFYEVIDLLEDCCANFLKSINS